MPFLVQISTIVACLAVVAIAVATIRAMRRVEHATGQLSSLIEEIRPWIGEAREFTRDARVTLVSVREAIDPIRRVADQLETLGEKTVGLSQSILREIEAPLRTALGVTRAVKSVTAFFLKRFPHRSTRGSSATQGERNGS